MGEKIAWIDDDYDRISSLVRQLKLDGHEILCYGTCQEVEEHFDEICQCDAVILDIILPPVTDDPYQGVSVLRNLREGCKYSGPVIVCTRVKNPNVLDALRELGVSEILLKPVRPSALYDAVTKALAEGTPETSQ